MNPFWKARLGVTLVFILGCLAGALLTAIVLHHRATLFFQQPGALMEVLEHRLTRHLHLKADQRSEVHDALLVNLGQRKLLQAEIRPQIKQLNERTVQQIQSILTPEQAAIFQENLDELHRQRAFPIGAGTDDSTNQMPSQTAAPKGL